MHDTIQKAVKARVAELIGAEELRHAAMTALNAARQEHGLGVEAEIERRVNRIMLELQLGPG